MPQDAVLTYFDLRGRAEASRLLLIDQGTEFDDRRIADPQEWSALRVKLPFGGLPHYRDESVEMTQGQAILRYLALRHDLMDGDPALQAIYGEAQEVLAEAQENLWAFAWKPEYEEDPQGYAGGILALYLRALGRWFDNHSGGQFWVGDSISHVDYLAFVYLDECRAFFPDALAQVDCLVSFHARMAARPGLVGYLASARRPVVFGMGLGGPKVDPAAALKAGQIFENPWSDPIVLV